MSIHSICFYGELKKSGLDFLQILVTLSVSQQSELSAKSKQDTRHQNVMRNKDLLFASLVCLAYSCYLYTYHFLAFQLK